MQENRITHGSIRLFDHQEFGTIRTVCDDAVGVMYCGRDIASALGYAKPNNAINSHCKGALIRGTLQTAGGMQEFVFITEPDVYRLIASSKLPAAQKFEKWLFEEVAPQVVRTGGYNVIDPAKLFSDPDSILRICENWKADRARAEKLEAQNAHLAPKAAFADEVLDSEGTYTVTEAARLLKQIDKDMTMKRLFALLRADEMIEKNSNKATAKAVERGYLYNYIPEAYEDPLTGEKKLRKPYARVKAKGLSWMTGRYCKGQQSLMIEVA